MKYLLFTFLLLSGCATQMSEYQRGCYDGIDKLIGRPEYNSSEYRSQTEERQKYVEYMKRETCQGLEDERVQRVERHEYPKGK